MIHFTYKLGRYLTMHVVDKSFKKVALYLFMLSVLSACSLPEIKKQAEAINSAGEITGKVLINESIKIDGPVQVVLFVKENGHFYLLDHNLVDKHGNYKFYVFPGDYVVAAYIDSNNDEVYQEGEPATYMGIQDKLPKYVRVNANQKVSVESIQIKGAVHHNHVTDQTLKSRKHLQNIGRVVSLEDPMFKRENASIGLWRPLDFVESVGGGLFLLQEYDDKKVPVVFVHGISGTPIEWREAIASLDKDKFQPWVLYYPSGAALDMISDYLVQSVNTLEQRYGFKQMYIVAHSMGGLVMRSYVMKHSMSGDPLKISFAMTVNSPMAGMSSARQSVKHSPIVIPSWRDVAKDSEFIQKYTAWKWPDDIPYHLFFSYQSGEGDDGVVSLESQIPSKLQQEAVKIYGFNSTHAGVLQDVEFIGRFNAILADSLHF